MPRSCVHLTDAHCHRGTQSASALTTWCCLPQGHTEVVQLLLAQDIRAVALADKKGRLAVDCAAAGSAAKALLQVATTQQQAAEGPS